MDKLISECPGGAWWGKTKDLWCFFMSRKVKKIISFSLHSSSRCACAQMRSEQFSEVMALVIGVVNFIVDHPIVYCEHKMIANSKHWWMKLGIIILVCFCTVKCVGCQEGRCSAILRLEWAKFWLFMKWKALSILSSQTLSGSRNCTISWIWLNIWTSSMWKRKALEIQS